MIITPPIAVIDEYIKFLHTFKNLNEMPYATNTPPSHDKIIKTIENHWYAGIYYTGAQEDSLEGFRLIEPYVYGSGFVSPKTGLVSHEDKYYLRCYVILDTKKDPDVMKQFGKKGSARKSASKSQGKLGWRLMRVDAIKTFHPIRKKITHTRPYYNANDKMIDSIDVSY